MIERELEGCSRFGGTSKLRQQSPSHNVHVRITIDTWEMRFVEQQQAGLRATRACERERAIYAHGRDRTMTLEQGIEIGDLDPFGVGSTRSPAMDRGDRGFDLIGAWPIGQERAIEQLRGPYDRGAIPARAILLRQRNDSTVRVETLAPSSTARVVATSTSATSTNGSHPASPF